MSRAREATFELWAPSSSPWSVWAKPVLFSQLPDFEPQLVKSSADEPAVPTWVAAVNAATLIVADLPGALGVELGERLVPAGFRPVPLYNALPGPDSSRTIVDVAPIIAALHTVSGRIQRGLLALPADARPVFLLDSQRRVGTPGPGDFDNRSISLPNDFPSATFLKSRGIAQVVLLMHGPAIPATDLAHTLVRWQNAGILISAATLDVSFRVLDLRLIRVRKPRWFRAIWHHALSLVGLRRNPLGGFGGTLPQPSAG